MQFSELGLLPEILTALGRAGYRTPTPIQQQAIGPALAGKDILGCAQTGTGKTAAFCLPILQRVDAMAGSAPALRALVLTPTRELAAQIGDSFKAYGAELDLYHTVIFGGVNEKPQIKELERGVDILVATPGRLMDLMGRGLVRLDQVGVFVLDEADRMLDMGFVHDVRRIAKALPTVRQTLLFSATMPAEIRSLATSLMKDPVHVSVAPVSSTAEKITQKVYFTDKPNKRRLLVGVLKAPEMSRTLVFSRTKHGANRIVKYLDSAGIASSAIHGNKSQAARLRALEGFRAGELAVLVATDIAARGIDIDGVTHVVNFDLPNVPETYVHRIGRTARAGAEGVALSFCESEERPYLADIERLIKMQIERVDENTVAMGDIPFERDASDSERSARPAISSRNRPQSRGQGQSRHQGPPRSSGSSRGPGGASRSPGQARGHAPSRGQGPHRGPAQSRGRA